MTDHDIALDVHSTFSEVAVVTTSGRVTRRERCLTTIPELVGVIESVPWPRQLTFEEGPLADWLFRNLRGAVERADLLKRLPRSEVLRADLKLLWEWYDLLCDQEEKARSRLVTEAGREPVLGSELE